MGLPEAGSPAVAGVPDVGVPGIDPVVLPSVVAPATGLVTGIMVPVVPAVAVFADASGAPHLWVVDSQAMTVASRAVTTGELTGSDSIVIASGLQPGERIATTGVSQLREGMKIRELSELEGYER